MTISLNGKLAAACLTVGLLAASSGVADAGDALLPSLGDLHLSYAGSDHFSAGVDTADLFWDRLSKAFKASGFEAVRGDFSAVSKLGVFLEGANIVSGGDIRSPGGAWFGSLKFDGGSGSISFQATTITAIGISVSQPVSITEPQYYPGTPLSVILK